MVYIGKQLLLKADVGLKAACVKIETSIQIPAIYYKVEFIAVTYCEIWVGRNQKKKKSSTTVKMCQLPYKERRIICGKYTYQKA